MPDGKTLVHMLFDNALIKRIDDFRFAHRFQSRTATVRWLIQWALSKNPTPPPEDDRA